MVGSQKSRSCLGAELVSQLSKFLKNRGSTRNSNHSTKSFVFSSQNISEHLTTSWYISFVLFRFFFNLFEVERQIGVLKSIIASKFYEIRWSLDFFFGHIFTHSLSLVCVRNLRIAGVFQFPNFFGCPLAQCFRFLCFWSAPLR